MDEVNVYLHDLNQGSIAIAKQVRMWGTRKVRLWVSEEALRQSSYKGLVANWRDGYVIDQSVQVDNSIGYYEWDLETVGINPITSGGLKALIQRCWTQNLQFVILGEVAKIKNHFAGFVDAPQWPKLPDVWHVCEWVTTYEELLALCQQRGVFDFDRFPGDHRILGDDHMEPQRMKRIQHRARIGIVAFTPCKVLQVLRPATLDKRL